MGKFLMFPLLAHQLIISGKIISYVGLIHWVSSARLLSTSTQTPAMLYPIPQRFTLNTLGFRKHKRLQR
jgi:hypothetical protein